MTSLDSRRVHVWRSAVAGYLETAPFDPDEQYPEYGDGGISESPNPAYRAVREVFRLAGLDAARVGTSSWNPLGAIIRPGERVVLKPNLIKDVHPRDAQGWRYLMTHGSVVRAVADFVWKALDGRGHVVICDAPQTDTSFAGVRRVLQLDAICDHFRRRGLDMDLIDLRGEAWRVADGVVVERLQQQGDPAGCIAYDLGARSEFVGHRGAGCYYGADYDSAEVNRHHAGGRHEYLVSGTVMQADVFINLPKLKTHKKAGITVALKNLVGINGDKNWLPHHTEAGAEGGGDEHPGGDPRHTVERRAAARLRALSLTLPGMGPLVHRVARRVGRHVFGDTETVIRSGNWWGNDTVWRMCLDLNKICVYGRPDGTIATARATRHHVLVDGLIAGDGRGPLNPDPVPAGLVLFGSSAPAVDAAAAWLIGFDPARLPIVAGAFRCAHLPLVEGDWRDVPVVSNVGAWCGRLAEIPDDSTWHFRPHFGWSGRVERAPDRAGAGPASPAGAGGSPPRHGS
jgi:uncharacterized protein (DUF362 family)